MVLPLVLAGPILRRAEPERICIWMATSEETAVRSEAFIDSEGSGPIGSSDPGAGGRETSVRLGDHLFVHLLEVIPLGNSEFPRDTVLFYDVAIGANNLAGFGFLEAGTGIAYDGLGLPSFFLPTRLATLAHGSCRKPHVGHMEDGEPSEDRLAVADRIIEEAPRDLSTRPAVLFLTGDQIYADDVGLPLIPALMNLGQEITGWQETMPDLGNPVGIPLSGRAEALAGTN